MNPRHQAAQIVAKWRATEQFPDRMIPADAKGRGAIMELSYGTIRWSRLLEWVLARYVKRPAAPEVHAILMVAVYELLKMSDSPDFAVVNEAVEAVKNGKSLNASRFANGVLRNLLREREKLCADIAAQPLGIRESHPNVLIERWTDQYGAEACEAMCKLDNLPPSVVVYPDCARISLAEFSQRLGDAGLTAEPHAADPQRALVLPRHTNVAKVPGFDEGLFVVRDPATMAAIDLLNPQAGQHVLDACASPGGKTVAIAQRMEGRGRLVAADVHADRMELLKATLARTGLTWVETEVLNAKTVSENPVFDAVLADVPCSNTGVLRRRPDARWRFNFERLTSLTAVQQSILDGLSKLVKPGGCMVYSTCSLEPEENTALVGAWLDGHAGWDLVETVQRLPYCDGTDGAFAARLMRRV